MRPEKKFLVDEVAGHLNKSEYVFLADYRRVTVSDVAELRASLRAQRAEFHVVKNSILNVAARAHNLPDLESKWLTGQTAIVVGGRNPSEVAKILAKFFKDKDKAPVKGGVLGLSRLTSADVQALATLPDIGTLRATLLGLLSNPGTSFVRVLNGVPQGLLNVLQAKATATAPAGETVAAA
jgi:large subunit ribosomal protein L10